MPRSAQAIAEGTAALSQHRLRTRPTLPVAGDLIAGKYVIVRTIGEGGMAVVFEATHTRLAQRFAIKVLRPDVRDFDVVLARFEREARATAKMRSIHTARVIDVDTLPNGLPYMVLEYLEGRDLDAELQVTKALPVEEAVDVALQVADAMAEAHEQGIIHRDLKPSNLFVCHAGERRIIKILDFGISRNDADESRITKADSYFGTPAYASPEQLRDAMSADARSDVWSLGVILYELLTGRTPFEGTAPQVIAKVVSQPVPKPQEFRPDLPRALASVVVRALERDPSQRFQTMRELAAALVPFGPKQSVADAVAGVQGGRGRLGEILVADGLLSEAGLGRALAEQRRTGKLLGAVLLDLGLVVRADLLAALARQQGISPWPTPEVDPRDAPTLHGEPVLAIVKPSARTRLRTALVVVVPVVVLAIVAAWIAMR
jgi:tRNA A-37 threonylcarbamoyl transferase component Bud32